MPTTKARIDAILGRNCPANGDVSAEAITVIRELEKRLAVAQIVINCGKTIRDKFGGNVGGGKDIFEEGLDATDLTKSFE